MFCLKDYCSFLRVQILCLQEVQEDHFIDFFQPRLAEIGL